MRSKPCCSRAMRKPKIDLTPREPDYLNDPWQPTLCAVDRYPAVLGPRRHMTGLGALVLGWAGPPACVSNGPGKAMDVEYSWVLSGIFPN